MASDKPVIVIATAAWHQPESYTKLTAQLQRLGYVVEVPPLPSINDIRPPKSDLKDDTKVLRDLVESLSDAGHNVIVIMHSYGGQVGSNSLCGLGREARAKQNRPGGVIHLVYMTAYALLEGKSIMDKVTEFGHGEFMPLVIDFPEDMSAVFFKESKDAMVGPDVSEEERDAYLNTLKRFNGNCLYQPIEQCAWREIPVTYIHATADVTIPMDYQISMVDAMRASGAQVSTFEIATAHVPNLTATEKVVAIIEQIAAVKDKE